MTETEAQAEALMTLLNSVPDCPTVKWRKESIMEDGEAPVLVMWLDVSQTIAWHFDRGARRRYSWGFSLFQRTPSMPTSGSRFDADPATLDLLGALKAKLSSTDIPGTLIVDYFPVESPDWLRVPLKNGCDESTFGMVYVTEEVQP